MSSLYRTHHCGELRKTDQGKEVKLSGWIAARRDHGKLIFFDLRDREGITQIVVNPKVSTDAYKIAKETRPEFVLTIRGKVNLRPENLVNEKIPTGEIELEAKEITILAKAETLPFEIEKEGYDINENLRFQYRYLDLRRPRNLRNLKMRQKMKNFCREFLTKRGFLEVDTPILTKSTPEGARDFLVPSRIHPGKFYALPQSPQQYKQLLMVAGIDKYFQFPRCFRDEDLRADRVLELDQLDLELSFITQEEVMQITEELVSSVLKEVFDKKIRKEPFPRLTYKEAIEKYKTDKPDLRKDKKDTDLMAPLWIVDFPLFEWHEEEKKWGPQHHPFTAPRDEDISLLDQKEKFGEIRAKQYDLVLNGFEVGGGSIRITDPKLQTKIFELLGYKKTEAEERFAHLLKAFQYGVPPHGGIALGFDRFLMAALGEKSIREVIPFPTTGKGTTSVMDAPSKVDAKQLKELHIKLNLKK